METKHCRGCGLDKPTSEFHKRRKGFQTRCKLCQTNYMRRFRQRFPEQVRATDRRRFENNREHVLERNRSYYVKHYKITGSQKGISKLLTKQHWEWLKEEYNYSCFHCGQQPEKLIMDRIIPGKYGGQYRFNNVLPACQPCNDSRGAKSVKEFHEYRRKLGLPVKEWD